MSKSDFENCKNVTQIFSMGGGDQTMIWTGGLIALLLHVWLSGNDNRLVNICVFIEIKQGCTLEL